MVTTLQRILGAGYETFPVSFLSVFGSLCFFHTFLVNFYSTPNRVLIHLTQIGIRMFITTRSMPSLIMIQTICSDIDLEYVPVINVSFSQSISPVCMVVALCPMIRSISSFFSQICNSQTKTTF